MINNISDCVNIIIDNQFYIQDDIPNQPSYIKPDNGQFEVINNTTKNINFLKIDNCIKFEQNDEKCDCAIFNNEVFCFIELKSITSDKSSTITKRRNKSQNQLKHTIYNFKNETIIQGKSKEAFVSITCNHQNIVTKITNSNIKDTILEFEEDYDTKLYYECKKEFN